MSGLLTFVLIIIVIVGFHESAHFLFMKLWGVKVIRFSIGFGPVLFNKKIGETEYQFAVIPLGGYVLPLSRKMDNMDGYKEHAEADAPEKYFEAKPAWQRMVIYLVGPLSNLLFAFVLYFLLFTCIGLPNETTVLAEATADYPAAQAGVKAGDRIEFIDGKEMKKWSDIVSGIRKSAGKTMKIGVLRDKEKKEFIVTPKEEETKDGKIYRIGITPALEYLKMPPGRALKESAVDTYGATMAYANFFKEPFTGKAKRDSFGGPIMIYQITAESAKQGAMAIFGLMIMLNMSLFAFNILPIPLLDGGQIYPALFEMLTGIKMSARFEYYWQAAGMLILGSLFILATWNDLVRIFFK